jgi:hypothetical protein
VRAEVRAPGLGRIDCCIQLLGLPALYVKGVLSHRYQAQTVLNVCAMRQDLEANMLGLLLVVVLILVLVGALPTWPHSRNWGYYPTGGLGLILLIVIILLLLGRI